MLLLPLEVYLYYLHPPSIDYYCSSKFYKNAIAILEPESELVSILIILLLSRNGKHCTFAFPEISTIEWDYNGRPIKGLV